MQLRCLASGIFGSASGWLDLAAFWSAPKQAWEQTLCVQVVDEFTAPLCYSYFDADVVERDFVVGVGMERKSNSHSR